MSPVLVSTINKAPTGDCINSVGYDNQSPGIISEFAIWNRALTISQINGFWKQTRFVNLVDAKLHIVNWGTRLNDVYHTDGVVHGRGGGYGNLPYIPYQVPPSSDSFCNFSYQVHQNIPGCGRVCSQSNNWRGVKRDGTWSQTVPCSACPGAQWPGCPKTNTIPSTTTYNVEPYAIVSKSYICAESTWATDIDGNGIFATVFNDGTINYMDCVEKIQKNYPTKCSTTWFAVASDTGQCLCVSSSSDCSSVVAYSHLYGLYKEANWKRKGKYEEKYLDQAMRFGPYQMVTTLPILQRCVRQHVTIGALHHLLTLVYYLDNIAYAISIWKT